MTLDLLQTMYKFTQLTEPHTQLGSTQYNTDLYIEKQTGTSDIKIIRLKGLINECFHDRFIKQYSYFKPTEDIIFELTTMGGDFYYSYLIKISKRKEKYTNLHQKDWIPGLDKLI